MANKTDKDLLRNRRKLTALLRGEFSLKQRFDKIDYELDVIQPEIKQLEKAAANGALPEVSSTLDVKKS